MADKNTYDNTLIKDPLVVLRRVDFDKLDPATVAMIGASTIGYGSIYHREQERELVWFADGFILNDQPRLDMEVKEIQAATLDFAVGRPNTGQVLLQGVTLKQAEQAVKGAKLTLGFSVELPKAEKVAKTKPSAREIAFSGAADATPAAQ